VTAQHTVHDAVKDAVIGWGDAPNLAAAAKALAKARQKLEQPLLPQLRSEVAEVSLETMMRMLAKAPTNAGEELMRVGEADLNHAQRERLSAWVLDLPLTGQALGLSIEDWHRELSAAAQRMIAMAAAKADDNVRLSGNAIGTLPRALPASIGDNPAGFVSQLAARLPKR
jgi:hypothetical protein